MVILLPGMLQVQGRYIYLGVLKVYIWHSETEKLYLLKDFYHYLIIWLEKLICDHSKTVYSLMIDQFLIFFLQRFLYLNGIFNTVKYKILSMTLATKERKTNKEMVKRKDL